jgi:hypothetical protein
MSKHPHGGLLLQYGIYNKNKHLNFFIDYGICLFSHTQQGLLLQYGISIYIKM